MTAIEDAIVELRSGAPMHLRFGHVHTILNAVASGDLITREASDARAGALLREAAGLPVTIIPYSPELKAALDALTGYRSAILAISPDATAALDRAVNAAREDALKEAERAARFAAEAKVAKLREALEDIARQKTVAEIAETEDIGMSSFEDGYDGCIDSARAALSDTKEAPDA